MLSFYRKYARTAFDIFMVALTAYLAMAIFSYLYKIATPVFLGLLIFLVIEPPAAYLHKKGMKKAAATAVSALGILAAIGAAFAIAGVIFTAQATQFAHAAPKYASFFQESFAQKTALLHEKIDALPPDMVNKANAYAAEASQKIAHVLPAALDAAFGKAKTFSKFVLDSVLGFILAYFLSLEIELWRGKASQHVPKTFQDAFVFLKENVFSGIGKYIKAQLKILAVTFILIFVGLLIAGANSAFSAALLASLFSVIPIVGTGIVFVPWIAYLLLAGQTTMAVWIAGVFMFSVILRHVIEPKIVGDSLGVSAFTMLASMIVSLEIFGVAGVIMAPVLLILVKSLIQHGHLKRWIHLPKD